MVLEHFVHALLGPLLIELFPLRIHPEHHPGDIEDNHGPAEGAALPGLRDGLGPQPRGICHAVAQIPVEVIGPPGPLQPDGLAGDAVVFRVGQGVERLGEVIAPLAQGPAVPGDGEVHPPSRGAVDAVLLHEVQAAPAGLQPLLLHAIGVAQKGENPAAPPLHPHALVGGVDLPRSVQAGVNPAVLPVHAVLQPEGGAAVQLIPHPLAGLFHFYPVHRYLRPFLCALRAKQMVFLPRGLLDFHSPHPHCTTPGRIFQDLYFLKISSIFRRKDVTAAPGLWYHSLITVWRTEVSS